MPGVHFFRLLLPALLAAPLLAQADVRYQITVVGSADSRAYDVNNLGQMVGYMNVGGNGHAFMYNGSIFNDLGTLGGASSGAYRINDSGQVVGSVDAGGFIYSGGVMTVIPGSATAIGINNAGAVVGWHWVPDENGNQYGYRHAYLFQGGSLTDLGTLPYGDSSEATAINNAGHVVGQAANVFNGEPNRPTTSFYFRDGVMTDIGGLGGIWSTATDINNLDQVVGYAGVPAIGGDLYPDRAYLWSGGVLHNLGSLVDNLSTRAYGINNLGQIVGEGDVFGAQHGFLYENGAMVDLNSLIDPAAGWTVQEAAGINDMQQIAATACKGGVCYAVRLDLVSAVPEPGSFAMCFAGLALLGLMRRRWPKR